MTIQKKPRNSVAIGVGVLCVILLIAIAAIYFDYSSIVTEKSNQISNLQTRLSGNVTALATANTQITSLQGQVNSLNAQISNLQTWLNGNQTALATANTQITSLQGQVNSLNAQISNLQTWLNGNQTALATANTQITSLNATMSSLNTQIATLTSQLTAANSQITGLQNEQVRDMTMIYIEAHHNETAQYMQSFSWTGGDITPVGLVGGKWYSYQSGGWNVTIKYPVGLPPGSITISSVTANYTSQVTPGEVIVSWQGTFQNGIITETAYTFNS